MITINNSERGGGLCCLGRYRDLKAEGEMRQADVKVETCEQKTRMRKRQRDLER